MFATILEHDATKTNAADTILAHVDVQIAKFKREDSYLIYLHTHSVNIEEERPKNPVERRQAAVVVFLYTHLHTAYDLDKMRNDIEAMRKLGRTDRWQSALNTWIKVLTEDEDKEWAVRQYAVYTSYAAM